MMDKISVQKSLRLFSGEDLGLKCKPCPVASRAREWNNSLLFFFFSCWKPFFRGNLVPCLFKGKFHPPDFFLGSVYRWQMDLQMCNSSPGPQWPCPSALLCARCVLGSFGRKMGIFRSNTGILGAFQEKNGDFQEFQEKNGCFMGVLGEKMGIFGGVAGENWAFLWISGEKGAFWGRFRKKCAFFSFNPIVLFMKSVPTPQVSLGEAALTLLLSPSYLDVLTSLPSKILGIKYLEKKPENSKLITPRASLLPTDWEHFFPVPSQAGRLKTACVVSSNLLLELPPPHWIAGIWDVNHGISPRNL